MDKTQRTKAGAEIPVPTWKQVMGDLKKAAKPIKKPSRVRRPKK